MNDRDSLTHAVIGAAIEVHRELGPGLLESVYEVCLAHELGLRGIDHLRQVPLPVVYKGEKLNADFRIDILIPDQLIIELKAVERLVPVHDAQFLTYLRLSKIRVGLLMNFNSAVLKDGLKRLIL